MLREKVELNLTLQKKLRSGEKREKGTIMLIFNTYFIINPLTPKVKAWMILVFLLYYCSNYSRRNKQNNQLTIDLLQKYVLFSSSFTIFLVCRNYPTLANVQKKEDENLKRRESGQILKTRNFR